MVCHLGFCVAQGYQTCLDDKEKGYELVDALMAMGPKYCLRTQACLKIAHDLVIGILENLGACEVEGFNIAEHKVKIDVANAIRRVLPLNGNESLKLVVELWQNAELLCCLHVQHRCMERICAINVAPFKCQCFTWAG